MQDLDWNFGPDDALAHWPRAMPLAALVTGAPDAHWGRWTLLASPTAMVQARSASEIEHALAMAEQGTWLACLAYELGAHFEPRAAAHHRPPPDGWPVLLLAQCDALLRYDHDSHRWSAAPGAGSLVAAVAARVRAGERPHAGDPRARRVA